MENGRRTEKKAELRTTSLADVLTSQLLFVTIRRYHLHTTTQNFIAGYVSVSVSAQRASTG